MTVMISDMNNSISTIILKTATALCMVAMLVGCSSGRDSNTRTMAQEEKAAEEMQLHDCKPEEMQALMKQAHKEAGSEGSRLASGAVSAGLSWIPVIGPVLAGANDVRQETKEWTQSSSQKSIDAIAGAKCDEHGNYVSSDTAKKMDKVNAVVNPLR